MPSTTARAQSPLILALDTSSSLGSVALARGETILKARAFEADQGHSQRLLPAIDAVFGEAELKVSEVDLFAAVIGPGSFTGLRVSLACVRGLAGLRPCFGALATDVAAWAGRGSTNVLAIADLFHGEVFGSVHDSQGALISGRESGDLASVMATLKGFLTGSLAATGSGTRRHRTQIEATCPGIAFLDLPEGLAPHLAILASSQASLATTCRAQDLLPYYLRDPLTRGLLNSKPLET